MSKAIDQRIVEMSFENHKFEKGIAQSKGSLKEFANALENSGTGKGFEGLEKSVNSVSSSLSMLEQIGVGALRRLGEMAVDAGTKMFKHLAVDPLSMGWDKYEQKTASVQTIMNATGLSIQEVNEHLDKLMWFSDETSYGFTDMTAALAQMTSSGGDVKKLIPLITGVANATAYAGKGAIEFQRSMYNINQSYGSGSLQFMDWKSLELAGVAGKDLKQIFIDTGIALGKLDKNGKTAKGTLVDIGNFGTTLSEKWADTSVMEAAFGKFSELSEAAYELVKDGTYDTAAEAMEALSGQYSELAEKAFKSAQQAKSFGEAIAATLDAVSTGWMKTYELIFGELDEATRNFSALTEVLWTIFASGAAARNEMIKLIKDGGGIKNLFQSIKNVAIALLTPLRAVSRAFDQFFPPKTADQWLSMISIIESVTRKLIITDETADKIQRTFAGFFAVIDIGWEVFKLLGSAVWELIGAFVPLGGSLFDTTASIGDFLVGLNRAIKETGIFQYALLAIKVGALLLKGAIGTIIDTISQFVHALLTAEDPLGYIGDMASKVFSGLLDILKNVTSWIYGKFTGAMTKLGEMLGAKFDMEGEGTIGGILKLLRDFIAFLAGEAIDGLKTFGETLNNLDFNKIATFVTGGVLLLFINQLTNLTKTANSLLATTNSFVTKFSKKLFGTTTKIKDLAYVFGILSASLFVLSKIPWNELARGFVGLAGALVIFVGAYAAVQAITVRSSKAMDGRELVKSTFSIVTLAASVAIMAVAVKKIASTGTKDVWNAVLVIGAMMGLLTAYQALSAVISLIPGQQAVAVKFSGMTFGVMGLVGIVAILKVITRDDLREGLSKLTELVLVLTGIQLLFSLAARVGGGKQLSNSILGISMGILTLIGVMKLLDVIKIEDLKDQVINVLLLGGLLSAINVMFGLAARVSGGAKFKTNILAIQVGMLTMLGLIALLKTFTPQEIQNGIQTIAKMALIIAGLEIFTALAARLGGGAKLQKILGAVTLTMLSFVALIGLLNIYEDQGIIDRGIASIAKMMGVIVMFELLSAAASRIGGGGLSGLTSMVGLVGALLAVTASIALLAIGDQDELRQAAISFSIAVVAVGVMAVGVSTLTQYLNVMQLGISGILNTASMLIQGFLVIGGIVLGAIELLGIIEPVLPMVENSWDGIQKFGIVLVALSGLIAGFTALTMLPGLQKPASILALVPAFVAVGGAIKATGRLFLAVNEAPKVDAGHFSQFITGLGLISALLVGFTLLGRPLSSLGPLIGPALLGALTAIAGVGMIILAFAGMAVLMEELFGSDPDFLVRGIDKLVLVGEGLGRLLGAFVGGFNAELLIGYGEGLAGFSNALSEVDTSALDNVGSIATALLAITATAVLDGISRLMNFFRNPIKVFGKQLQGLVDAFAEIDASQARKASSIIDILAPMTDNLGKLIEVANKIPNSGGGLGLLMGNNDIGDFGLQLKDFMDSFATATVEDANKTSNILAAAVPMIESLREFIDVAKEIPNDGGVLGFFMGNNDIATFGNKVAGLIDAFKDLDENGNITTVGINLDLMTRYMLPSLKKFSDLSNGLDPPSSQSLSTFAKEIVGFIKAFNGVNFDIIQPALKAMSEITVSFGVIGKDVMVNATESFRNNKIPFQKEITNILQEAVKVVDSKKKDIVSAIISIFPTAISQSKLQVSEFRKLGVDLMKGLKSGIEGEVATTTKAMKNVSNKVVETAKNVYMVQSPSKVFAEIGGWLSKGLAHGITSEADKAINASETMGYGVEMALRDSLGIYSLSDKIASIGEWFDKSVISGLKKGGSGLFKVAEGLGLDLTKFNIKGMTEGLAGGEGAITSGITSLLDLLTGTPVSTAAESTGDKIGDKITSGMNASLGDSKKGLAGSETKKTIKTALEELQTEIDELKFYGNLSLEEELAKYETLKLKKGQSAEDYKKIDREVYRLVKEIYEGQLSYIDEVTKAEEDAKEKREELYSEYIKNQTSVIEESEKKIADLTKKYDKDRASAKETARKKEADAEKKYSDDYNKILENAEKERQKIREDYSAKQKSINEKLLSDIDAQNKAYENAVKSRADSIYNSYSLFSKVDEDAEVSGEELLENLRDQGAALSEWQQALEALAARGVGDALIEELQKMGPSSKAQLKALLELTDEQLDEYVGLFHGKYAFARVKAETELEGMKQDTIESIKELNRQASIDLKDLEYTFAESMANVNSKMSDDLTELKNKHSETLAEINKDLQEKLDEMQATFDEKTSEINKDTAEKLKKLEEDYNKSLDTINKDTDKKLEELAGKYADTMKTIRGKTLEEMKGLILENESKLKLLNEDTKALLKDVEKTYDSHGDDVNKVVDGNMEDIKSRTEQGLNTLNRTVSNKLHESANEFERAGYNASRGFAQGILAGMDFAVDAAQNMANAAIKTARDTLEERSPSRVFAAIGQFASLGFANGIMDYADKATNAAEKMASGPIAAVTQALANLETDTGLDTWEPVITPVLDLSNIRLNALDGLLGSNVDLAFRSAGLANEISQNGSGSRETVTSIVNNFDLTGLVVRKESDIDQIATKLFQKQQSAQRGRGLRTVPTGR